MRVTLVAPHFPPRYLAGVEILTNRLAAWLLGRGHRPEVVCVESLDAPADTLIRAETDTTLGFPVHRLSLPARDFARTYHDSAVEAWLTRHLEQEPADVLHLQSGYQFGAAALAAAQRAGVPRVVTLHDYWFVCPRITMLHPSGRLCSGPDHGRKCAWCVNGDRRVLRAIDRPLQGAFSAPLIALTGWSGARAALGFDVGPDDLERRHATLKDVLAAVDLVTSTTEFVADRVAREFGGRVRVRVLRGGLERGAAFARSPRADAAPLRVGYLGQVARHKGVDVLIRAVRAVPNARLILDIRGALEREPVYVAELRRCAEGDSRVRLAGAYPNADVGRLLAGMDVLVVPSVWHENYPSVILEAHAAGVPVIASRVGGLPEMVRDGIDGVLVPPGDVARLGEALSRCADDPGFLRALASGVRPPPSADEEGEQWLAVYEGLRAGRAGGPDGVVAG